MEQRLVELTKENNLLKNRLDSQQQLFQTTPDSVIVAGPSVSSSNLNSTSTILIHPKAIFGAAEKDLLYNYNNNIYELNSNKIMNEGGSSLNYNTEMDFLESSKLMMNRSAFSIPNLSTSSSGNLYLTIYPKS